MDERRWGRSCHWRRLSYFSTIYPRWNTSDLGTRPARSCLVCFSPQIQILKLLRGCVGCLQKFRCSWWAGKRLVGACLIRWSLLAVRLPAAREAKNSDPFCKSSALLALSEFVCLSGDETVRYVTLGGVRMARVYCGPNFLSSMYRAEKPPLERN